MAYHDLRVRPPTSRVRADVVLRRGLGRLSQPINRIYSHLHIRRILLQERLTRTSLMACRQGISLLAYHFIHGDSQGQMVLEPRPRETPQISPGRMVWWIIRNSRYQGQTRCGIMTQKRVTLTMRKGRCLIPMIIQGR